MACDFPDLLSHWTERELATDLDVPVPTAASMKQRGSVAPAYWPRLIEAAETKALRIDADMLARFAAQRKMRGRANASEAAD